MRKILITNNPSVINKFNNVEIVYLNNAPLLEVFIYVRNCIHQGAKLLTHPLTSSIKPDETPYKSILILKSECYYLDFTSLEIISNSIEVVEKFLKGKNKKNYNFDILKDFQAIDLAIIASGIESMGG
ncbi:MAG: GrdX family protein [Cetobacterium sp.]